MKPLPTIKIASPHFHGGFAFINAYEFDSAKHTKFEDAPAPMWSEQLRTDGPTIEEYVAAGYTPGGYPPPGYAEKASAGLDRFKATGAIDEQKPNYPGSAPGVPLPPIAAIELPDGFSDLAAKDAIETVKTATDMDSMRAALEVETRATVRKAIETRLTELMDQ